MQAAPGRTVERDVQRKTQKLLQFQICSDYTSVAHKILKGMKRVDAGLRSADSAGAAGGWQKTATRPQAQNPFESQV